MKQILDMCPCPEARAWLLDNKTLTTRELYDTCPQGDWLIWLAARLEVDQKLLVLASCDCVETVLQYTDDPRPARALKAARDWVAGKATEEEVWKITEQASLVHRGAYGVEADIAAAAAYAAYIVQDPGDGADAAASRAAVAAATHAADDHAAVAHAKMSATRSDTYYAAYDAASAAHATLVRSRISFETFETALQGAP